MNGFLNPDPRASLSAEAFRSRQPFPWQNFDAFLTPDGFRKLHRDFPALDLFEEHEGIDRNYGQRPHDRYYLAYEVTRIKGIEHQPGKGVVRHRDLPETWQRFIEEIEASAEYRDFIRSALDIPRFQTRYSWHLSFTRSEVSPHQDARRKVGTHIFYFNESKDWNSAWGGETVVLAGQRVKDMNPDFGDFDAVIPIDFLDNRSILLKNAPQAWHGMKALRCPEGQYRRSFNVIFEHPKQRGATALLSAPLSLARRLLKQS